MVHDKGDLSGYDIFNVFILGYVISSNPSCVLLMREDRTIVVESPLRRRKGVPLVIGSECRTVTIHERHLVLCLKILPEVF